MKVSFSRKTISIPTYLAKRLDQVSDNTGYSVSNILMRGLAEFLYRFEDQEEAESMECWLERLGRGSGLYESGDSTADHNMTTDMEGETLM